MNVTRTLALFKEHLLREVILRSAAARVSASMKTQRLNSGGKSALRCGVASTPMNARKEGKHTATQRVTCAVSL
jgi:hypothetical protein